MRQLHYVNSQVVVADVVCKSVLRYARALAIAGTSDVVSIPVRLQTGARASAFLVLGPASQLFSTPVVEPEGDEAATRDSGESTAEERESAVALERMTERLQPSRPGWDDELVEAGDFDPDLDL